MARVTPFIGARGAYTLKPPWEALADTVYTCTGLVSFTALLEKGTDVLNEVYVPNGLGEVEYSADLAAGAYIVVLASETAPTLYVPDTYVVSYPDTGLVKYSHIVASASLGALPDELDLSFLQEQLSSTIEGVLGIETEVSIHKAPTTKTITPSQHQTLEAARRAQITLSETDRAKAVKASEEVVRLTEHVAELEAVIVSLHEQLEAVQS
jgi:hypothetical protein